MMEPRSLRWLVPAAALFIGGNAVAQVHYVSDFDGATSCSSTCTTACNLVDTVWRNDNANDQTDWLVDSNGTPTSGTGPSGDHTTGSGKYLYVEASSCSPSFVADLVSADIQLPMGGLYRLEFWYHLYGTDQPSIHVDIDPDGGGNLYSDHQFVLRGNEDRWQRAVVDLSHYAEMGDATINIRLRGVTGGSFTGDPAIDDISIVEYNADDLRLVSIDQPTPAACNPSDAEEVTVVIENTGGNPQSMFPVEYVLDDGTPVTEIFTGTIQPGETAAFTFSTPLDLSDALPHSFSARVALAGDGDPSDDALSIMLEAYRGVTSYPSVNDFEPGNPYAWFSGGTSSSWALTTPANAIIAGAASGMMAWVTNPTGSYNNGERSWVQSRCGYDFTSVTNPVVRLNIWWESENSWDGANVMSSIDDGATWQLVGTMGDPISWYNDDTINGNPGGSPMGWTGRNGSGSDGYVTAVHDLDGLEGQESVLFRVNFGSDSSINDEGVAFDDFEIFDDLDRVLVRGLGPGPQLNTYLGGETNVLLLAASVEAFGQDQTIDTVTVTNIGTLPDEDFRAVRLWADNGDGVFDQLTDTRIGADQGFTNGVATFPVDATMARWARRRIFVTVDLVPKPTVGATFDAAVLVPEDVVVANGAPVELEHVYGPERAIFGPVSELPWSDALDDNSPVNRSSTSAPGAYPAAMSAGGPVGILETNNAAVVTLSDGATGPAPYAGPYMGAFNFPNGSAAGAIDYLFDLSAFDAAEDAIWLRFQWNNTGQENSHMSNVFVSLDRGATWAAAIYHWNFSDKIPMGWHEEIIDLSATLRDAGLDYTDEMIIRFQAGGDEFATADIDGLQLDEIWLGEPQLAKVTRIGVDIRDGGTDGLGKLPVQEPVILTYALENRGDLPLVLDPGSVVVDGMENVANVTVTPTVDGPIAPGQSATFEIAFDIQARGAFGFEVALEVDDPRLLGGAYEFSVIGAGAAPNVAIFRDGEPVAAGATDDLEMMVAAGQTVTYTIQNVGAEVLIIDAVDLGAQQSATVALTSPSVSTLAPRETATFAVTVTPDGGPFSFDVMVRSDDEDSPYGFTVTGMAEVVEAGGCCSSSDAPAPWGSALLALVMALALWRPRRHGPVMAPRA